MEGSREQIHLIQYLRGYEMLPSTGDIEIQRMTGSTTKNDHH